MKILETADTDFDIDLNRLELPERLPILNSGKAVGEATNFRIEGTAIHADVDLTVERNMFLSLRLDDHRLIACEILTMDDILRNSSF